MVGGCVGFLRDIIATMTVGLPLVAGLWLVAAAAAVGFLLGVLLGGRRGN